MHRYCFYILFLVCAGWGSTASAQRMPERGAVRSGNRQFDKGNYEKSIERYERALTFAPESFEAAYDLGNAFYKAERYDQAEQTLRQAAADTLRTETERAETFFNLGNAQFRQQKYKEALESYKQSLRLNPSDMEAKYNYAYTKRLLDDQQNNGGGGQDEQNQDQQGQEGQNEQNQANPQQNDSSDGQQSDEQQDSQQSDGDPQQDGEDDRQGPATGCSRRYFRAGAGTDARCHPSAGRPHAGEAERETTGCRRAGRQELVRIMCTCYSWS